jgi:hypothetical protein
MSTAPTLQTLALYARDHFGEDGQDYSEGALSSLDVVVARYVSETNPEAAVGHIAMTLCRHKERGGVSIDAARAYTFSRMATVYLRAVHPDATHVGAYDRWLLSRLFWGHLVEARFAAGSRNAGANVSASHADARVPALV